MTCSPRPFRLDSMPVLLALPELREFLWRSSSPWPALMTSLLDAFFSAGFQYSSDAATNDAIHTNHDHV